MLTAWSVSRPLPDSRVGVRVHLAFLFFFCASLLASVQCQEYEMAGTRGNHAPRARLLDWSYASTSELWGLRGSSFKPKGRLLDWSYAGYAAGEADIPRPRVTASVKDYGAKGDGTTDDTAAFIAAVEANKRGVLFIPKGRYVIRGFINITSRLSLRGAGSKLTTLVFPNSLADIYGDVGQDNNTHPASQWSFGTAFINYNGDGYHNKTNYVGAITHFAPRGTNKLRVTSLAGLRVGQWVSVVIGNRPGPGSNQSVLFWDMNVGLHQGCTTDARCFGTDLFSFQSRVAAIKGRHTLVLERPLPYNISTAFAPAAVHRWAPHLANIGVEGMAFEMMSPPYIDHFNETGYNALQLNNVSNAWVRDVVFNGTDMALTVFGCTFMTITKVLITAPVSRLGPSNWTGHHAFFSIRSADTLFSKFNINVLFVHDLSVDYFSRGVVWSQGRGIDMNLDHHKAQTYGILWTQLDLGDANRPFESGGAKGVGLNAGALTTFWNIANRKGTHFGPSTRDSPIKPTYGPALNFIGCGPDSRYPSLHQNLTSTWWVEYMSPDDLQPANIFLAQQALRLASDKRVSPVLGGHGQGGDLLTLY